MSWELVRKVFESSDAKPMARLVLLNLAEHATSKGLIAWPSRKTIARECGLSERGVQKLLLQLRNLGEIELVGSNRGGLGRSNRYRIKLPKGECESLSTRPQSENKRACKGVPRSPEPEEPEVPPLQNSPPAESLSTGRLRAALDDSEW